MLYYYCCTDQLTTTTDDEGDEVNVNDEDDVPGHQSPVAMATGDNDSDDSKIHHAPSGYIKVDDDDDDNDDDNDVDVDVDVDVDDNDDNDDDDEIEEGEIVEDDAQDGRQRRYEREFLLSLQFLEQCKQRPPNLINAEYIRKVVTPLMIVLRYSFVTRNQGSRSIQDLILVTMTTLVGTEGEECLISQARRR